MTKLDAIKAFEQAGFSLIPLNGKIPAVKNWVDCKPGTYKPEELEPGNYGVVIPDGVLVIDVDPRNFAPADKPVSRLCADLGIAPSDLGKTLKVQTGGGGLHLFFKMPAGVKIVNQLELYPGVEFKALGRQVVGAGSIHPDTKKEYKLAHGSPSALLDAPSALIAAITAAPSAQSEANAGTDTYKDDTGTRERFASFLKDQAPLAIEGQGGDNTTFKVAARGRDLGLPPERTLALMSELWNGRCVPPWAPSDLSQRVQNAYKYAKMPPGNAHPEADFPDNLPPAPPQESKDDGSDLKWETTKQGFIKVNFNNLINHLKSPKSGLREVFAWNEFTNRPEIVSPAPWHKGELPRYRGVTDADLKLLKAHLAVNFRFEMAISQIEEAVCVVAHRKKFHPIRDFLSGLVWDGKPRLDTWLSQFCGAPADAYTQALSRKVICAAIQRVFHPGIKFDYALVLEGEQGIGKSAICKILGGEWAGDFPLDPHSKDTIQMMQGRWIMELAELEVARRADSDALKAFISRPSDTARLAYGRLALEYPRQSIFIATKNPNADGTYLKDDTGNRRWWPVYLAPKSGMIDFKGLEAARDQIFAEAMHLLKSKGEPLDMDTPELKSYAADAAAARHAQHEWTERIAIWIENLDSKRDFLTVRDIYIEAMDGMERNLDRRVTVAVASVMRHLGWKKTVRRFGSRTVRGYAKPGSAAEVLGDLA